MTPPHEEVVLLAEDGTPIGTADKATVHTAATPLHLAFSCHLFDGEGRILVTRRALGKATWPGVWTPLTCARYHTSRRSPACRSCPGSGPLAPS